MARKPSDIVAPNLRIREDLRRRLETAAKKRGVSLNYEMTSRLTASFDREDLFKLDRITSGMEIQWARWDAALFDKEQCGDLVRAAEALLAALKKPAPDHAAVEKATAQVETAITAIDVHAKASARGRTGGDQ